MTSMVRGFVLAGCVVLLISPGAAEGQELRLALNGYCPASYLLSQKATRGDAKFAVPYRGQLYHLCSEEAKEKFEAEPARFLPQFDGLCTLALGGPYGNRFPGDPALFDVVDGKVYLLSSPRAQRAYELDKQKYIAGAKEVFAVPAQGGMCPVTYFTDFRAMPGEAAHQMPYKGWVWHLKDEEKLKLFEANPEKYMAEFDGYCVMSIAEDKIYGSNPGAFIVSDGKLYLFYDQDTRTQFMLDPKGWLDKARKNWPALKEKKSKVPK